MTLNCSETNVGKIQEVWDKAGYVKAIGEHRGEGVGRETNWKKVYSEGMQAMTTM